LHAVLLYLSFRKLCNVLSSDRQPEAVPSSCVEVALLPTKIPNQTIPISDCLEMLLPTKPNLVFRIIWIAAEYRRFHIK
jgi:hypothetical protein